MVFAVIAVRRENITLTFDLFIDIVKDTLLDCLKMLPFLFLAFLLLEAVEHHAGSKISSVLAKSGKAGPLAGALLGCVPQCGFSVFSANLYSGGVITLGTLISVFIATSDEAIIIMISNRDKGFEILKLLIVKVIIATVFGYIIDLICSKHPFSSEKHVGDLCRDCGCHDEHNGILKPAIHHTLKILGFLVVIVFALNLAVETLGIDRISRLMLGNSIFQPFIAAAIGLIPNCAASVLITELYLEGAISFASVVAGLCTGAGAGLIVLFRENHSVKENIKIIGILYVIAVASGMIITVLPL